MLKEKNPQQSPNVGGKAIDERQKTSNSKNLAERREGNFQYLKIEISKVK